jgi:hypothetical protein
MHITIEKTQSHVVVPRSIAFQARAISDGTEVIAMFGSTEQKARMALMAELQKLQGEIELLINVEIDDMLTSEMTTDV